MTIQRSLAMVLLVAFLTFLLRGVPFRLFGGNKKMPDFIKYLAGILPSAMMAILVVYCLKNIDLRRFPFGLPELISSGAVMGLHLWKRNTLLSIGGGTLLYMFLLRVAF